MRVAHCAEPDGGRLGAVTVRRDERRGRVERTDLTPHELLEPFVVRGAYRFAHEVGQAAADDLVRRRSEQSAGRRRWRRRCGRWGRTPLRRSYSSSLSTVSTCGTGSSPSSRFATEATSDRRRTHDSDVRRARAMPAPTISAWCSTVFMSSRVYGRPGASRVTATNPTTTSPMRAGTTIMLWIPASSKYWSASGSSRTRTQSCGTIAFSTGSPSATVRSTRLGRPRARVDPIVAAIVGASSPDRGGGQRREGTTRHRARARERRRGRPAPRRASPRSVP